MADGYRVRRKPTFAAALAAVGVGVAAAAGDPDAATRPVAREYVEIVQVAPTGFTHAEHADLACFTCHENTAGHGALTITTIEDCRDCHHAPDRAAPCVRCHASPPDGRFDVVRAVTFSVPSSDARRLLGFAHDEHADIDCARCHTGGSALAVPADLDCASCHEDHHAFDSDCASCHAVAPVAAHPSAEVHVTCSGSACHQDVPFEEVPRTRTFCLGCHRAMAQHEVARECVQCHILPAPRGSP